MNPDDRQRLVHTPRLDAWRAELRIALEPRGAKTELAQFMAGERGMPVHNWRVRIHKMLRDKEAMNAEDVLAISAWMASRPA
jgi:hypothetical protein